MDFSGSAAVACELACALSGADGGVPCANTTTDTNSIAATKHNFFILFLLYSQALVNLRF
jgi:hypothetical protein